MKLLQGRALLLEVLIGGLCLSNLCLGALPIHFIYPDPERGADKATRQKFEQEREIFHGVFEATIAQVERVCAELDLSCESFKPFRVKFVRSAIQMEGEGHLAGYIHAHSNEITLIAKPTTAPWTMFHELMHWIHYNVQLQSAGEIWSVQRDYDSSQWFSEALTFMAGLLYGPSSDRLTASEISFLENKLSGSLTQFRCDSDSYGLVGLWARYLVSHLGDAKKLLNDWLHFTPKEGPNSLFSFDLAPYRPVSSDLPAGIYRLPNFFHYFTMALELNTRELEKSGIYSLELPQLPRLLKYNLHRLKTLEMEKCLELQPLDFLYASTEILKGTPTMTQSGDLRITLFRGRQMPIDLSRKSRWMGVEHLDWYRILIFNPSMSVQKICFSSPNSAELSR